MPLFLEEVTEILRSIGLDSEDRKGFRKFPPGPGRAQPRRVYVRLTRGPVSRIDIAGEFVDPLVEPIAAERAEAEHRTSIRGEVDPGRLDDEACRALLDRLGRWVLATPPRSVAARAATTADDADDDPGGPLPDIDPARLDAWIEGRLGYGAGRASAWFLGMEEPVKRGAC